MGFYPRNGLGQFQSRVRMSNMRASTLRGSALPPRNCGCCMFGPPLHVTKAESRLGGRGPKPGFLPNRTWAATPGGSRCPSAADWQWRRRPPAPRPGGPAGGPVSKQGRKRRAKTPAQSRIVVSEPAAPNLGIGDWPFLAWGFTVRKCPQNGLGVVAGDTGKECTKICW